MFRTMRRIKQELCESECYAILNRLTHGVLALAGDDGYPYALPINYVVEGNKIYFHCAQEGHKIDAIRRCDKASFCVVDQDLVVPEELTDYFRSVIAFGKIHIIEDEADKYHAIDLLIAHYCPDLDQKGRDASIQGGMHRLCMLEFNIENISGKHAKALMLESEKNAKSNV